MSMMQITEGETPPVPKEQLGDNRTIEDAVVIPWIDLETWEYLKYCRAYCLANAEDISSKLVYRNLLRAYTCA